MSRKQNPPLARLVCVYAHEDKGARDGSIVLCADIGAGGAPRIRLPRDQALRAAQLIVDCLQQRKGRNDARD